MEQSDRCVISWERPVRFPAPAERPATNLQYRHQHHLHRKMCLCPAFASEKRDKQKPSAMCSIDGRRYPLRLRVHRNRRDLDWPVEETPKNTRSSRSTSRFRKMPRTAICQSPLLVNARQIPPAPLEFTSEAQTGRES